MDSSAHSNSDAKVQKILVCITVQANSKRLIKKGAEIAKQKSGQLHILHVQKGNNIFINLDASELLQQLYEYASELGGETHAICGEDVGEAILNFIKALNITTIILGESNKTVNNNNDIITKIKLFVPDIEIIVLEREKNTQENLSYERRFA